MAFVQEQVQHVHHRVQVAPAVAPEVHHQRRGALGGQAEQRALELLGGVGGEPNGLDVAHFFFQHEGRDDALDGDSVADQMDLEGFAPAVDAEVDLGAARPLEQFHDPAVVELGA